MSRVLVWARAMRLGKGETRVQVLYSDRRATIDTEALLLRDYYWPFGAKRILLGDIEKIVVVPCTLATGKYRLYGTGAIGLWMPLDWRRPSRDRVFIIFFKRRWLKVGFTVEDGAQAEGVLRSLVPVERQGEVAQR